MAAADIEQPPISEERSASKLIEHFQYKPGRDSPSDVRNVLLVIASLIASATFAVGVNPPGGVWQETKNGSNPRSKSNDQIAGASIYGSNNGLVCTILLCANSAAFSASTVVITYLVSNFPFYLEIWLALFFMAFTYGALVVAVYSDTDVLFRFVYLAMGLPYIIRIAAHIYRKYCMCK